MPTTSRWTSHGRENRRKRVHLASGETPQWGLSVSFLTFNSKRRAECLNAHWFMSLADARDKLEDWRRHYNADRPHSAIGYNLPIAMHYPDGVTSPSS